MINDNLDYQFFKVKNGKPFFAIVNLEVSRSDADNEIIEDYFGEGWITQGHIESVPNNGYEHWKKAVIKGLEFAFSLSNEKWKVKIKKVEGRIATDTNPTIVGFVTILAFCEQANLILHSDLKSDIEDFTFNSWNSNNDEKIPDFFKLEYHN